MIYIKNDGFFCISYGFLWSMFLGGSRALRKAFSDVDLDGNGQLDYYELGQALKVNTVNMLRLYSKFSSHAAKLGI